MSDIHISRDILRAVVQGKLSQDDLTSLILTHLLELCPTCCHELESIKDELLEEVGECGASPLNELVDHLEDAGPQLEATLDEERTRAEDDLQTLLRLPHDRRLARIRRANRRFRSPFLANRLLDECRASLPARCERALEFAQLSGEVALYAPSPLCEELSALAKAHQGNALRAAGRLSDAREFLDAARQAIRTDGVVDTAVVAEIDWLEGTLDRDQGRYQRSESLLKRAATLFELAHDPVRSATVCLSLGKLYRDAGDLEHAIEVVTAAGLRKELKSEPRLLWCLVHNRLMYLAEAGRFADARHGLRDAYPRYQQFPDPWTQLRLMWLESKIDAGLGYQEQAIEGFTATRDGFFRQGNGFDAALVSLELALLLLEMGRTQEVQRVAEEISAVFEAQDVHREAVAALILFQRAAAAERVTEALVGNLVTYLEQARKDPCRVFRGLA